MLIKTLNAQNEYVPHPELSSTELIAQPNLQEARVTIPNGQAQYGFTEWTFEGIKVVHMLSQQPQRIRLYGQRKTPGFDMYFQLAGHNHTQLKQHPAITFAPNQQNLFYTPHFEGEFNLEGHSVSSLIVQLPAHYFLRFLEHDNPSLRHLAQHVDQRQVAGLLPHNGWISPPMKAVIYQIIHCQRMGGAKRLLLESSILELLMLQIDQAEAAHLPVTTGSSLKAQDVERIRAAQEYLDTHFLQPITLLELSRVVGLNDFKLKKGFREVLGTTVLGYLTDLRMEYAKALLLDQKQTISEVAGLLGYRYVHHFANAFRRKFGYLPSALT